MGKRLPSRGQFARGDLPRLGAAHALRREVADPGLADDLRLGDAVLRGPGFELEFDESRLDVPPSASGRRSVRWESFM